MKTYEIEFSEETLQGFKVSIVKDPAVESKLMAFSKDEKPMFFQDEEKRIIYSVAMTPNKLIPRNDINGEPAYVFYNEKTIEEFQQRYFKTFSNQGVNINHSSENTSGIFPFESWIVKDKNNDKSNALNMSAENNSLVMAFKIENDEVWADCKNGNLDGLSIEGYFNLKPIINMNKQEEELTFYEKVKALFAMQPPVVEETEDVKDPEAPEVEEPEDLMEELKAENEALKAEVADLKEKLATLEADKVKAETELVSMSKQAMSVEKVVNAPVEVFKPYEQMSNFEKLKFNRENR